ncbi:MAG: hypothetical protein KGV59_00675 [Tenacibaculum sp.]|nr:hypothetical protein [Tenacibaculum sp.]
MNRDITKLVLPIIGVFVIGYSLVNDGDTIDFLGSKVSSWVYRGLWALMIVVGVFRYYKSEEEQE